LRQSRIELSRGQDPSLREKLVQKLRVLVAVLAHVERGKLESEGPGLYQQMRNRAFVRDQPCVVITKARLEDSDIPDELVHVRVGRGLRLEGDSLRMVVRERGKVLLRGGELAVDVDQLERIRLQAVAAEPLGGQREDFGVFRQRIEQLLRGRDSPYALRKVPA